MTGGDIQDTNNYIAITTKIPIVTTPHQPTIDGTADTAYFLVSKLNYKAVIGNKIIRMSKRYSYSDKRGVVANFLAVRKGWLLNKDINRLVEKIINGGHTQFHTLLYMLVKLNAPGGGSSQSTATHLAFSDINENIVWYLKGHLKVIDIDIEGKDLYQLKFLFAEVLSGT